MRVNKMVFIGLLILIIMGFLICILNNDNQMYILSNKDEIEQVDEEWIPVSDIDISNVPGDVIGYLSIPSLSNNYYIDMPIKETVGLNVLATSIGHFEETPYTNGNVCLAAHNSGRNKKGEYVGYFDSIKELKEGDYIIYNNISNTYTYKVISNTIINETDISVLNNTEDNRLTLITCVKGAKNRAYRQCVVATRID